MEYNEKDNKTINQAIKNNELKNIELGYPSERRIKAIKQINAKKREIISTHKIAEKLKKDKKVNNYKKRRRKDTKLKRGFRKSFTKIRITKIAA